MHENNYPELVNKMEALGLGKDPSLHLLNSIYQGLPSINLHVRNTFGADQIDAFLHFTKTEVSNKYVFTNWDLEVKNQEQSITLKQTFGVFDKEDSVTLMEGFNLLQGRSIYKTLPMENGEKISSWCALDFKNPDFNGNYKWKIFGNQYNLEELVLRHPIKEMQKDLEKKWLIQELKEGCCVPVTIQKEKGEQKVYIEAAPKFNTVKFYDADNRPMIISKELLHNQNEKRNVRQAEQRAFRPAKIRL